MWAWNQDVELLQASIHQEGMEECPGSIRAGALSSVVVGGGGGGVSWGAKAHTLFAA